jgi:hypothetical protein
MPEIPIDDLASIGVIQDEPGYQIPPEGWTLGQNVRYIANGVEMLPGWSPTLGTNPRTSADTPMFLMYISSAAQPWWLWASLAHIYIFDGVTDTDITRAVGGNYTAADAKSWTGTLFQGVPILTSRTDNPQFWATYSAGQKMQDLSNWPLNTKTRVMRSFLSYLFALNNTSAGVNLPHQVRWSNAAVPGSLPTTWDFTDPTNDAGSTDLPDVASGMILDGQELQGQFFIYKEASAWRVQFIGSPFVFSFHSFMENTGILATRCLAMTADGLRHVVATQDDIIIHNGISAESLLSKRMRRYLFNRIDAANYDTSFMFTNPVYDEIWFCYPSTGQSEPDSALVWNYKYNTFSEATGIDFRATEIGTIPVTGLTWAAQTLQWQQDTAPWASSKRRRIVLANPNTKKLLLLDDTGTVKRDGLVFTGTLQRTGLSVAGQKRNGQWVVDYETFKFIQSVWPKIQAQSPINVRVGYAQVVNGSTQWNAFQTFDPNSQVFVEGTEGSGRSIGIEINSQNGFRIDGYKLDLQMLGKFG